MPNQWSGYEDQLVLKSDEYLKTVAACSPQGDRVLIHRIQFPPDTAPSIRMRLEYETSKYALPVLLEGFVSTVRDFEFSDTSATIVTTFLSGHSLRERLQRGPLSVDDAVAIAEDLLSALNSLHTAGMVRRFLMPEEICIRESDGKLRAGIRGFGPLQSFLSLTVSEVSHTAAIYSSPEALGALEEDVRPSSDLYAMGVLLFEFLTGRPPFVAETAGDLVFQHMTSPIPDLTLINPRIPRALADITERLLQKHPRDRYQSAAGVLFDLRQSECLLQADFPQCLVLGTMDRRESLIEPAFVGRSDIIGILDTHLSATAQGNSAAIILSGASGLGKSRIFLEFARIAAVRSFRILKAGGINQAGLAPLASLQSALQHCVGIAQDDEELRGRMKSELASYSRELQILSPQLCEVIGLDPVSGRSDDLSDRRLAVALAAFLGSLGTADRPVLILLDDMQWADDLTLTMLECWHLTNARYTLLLVGTRPAEGVAERLLQNLSCSARIALEPLSRREHDQLLQSMAGGLPAQVSDLVWEMSTGNPFVASAVLRGLVESAVLTASGAGWQVDENRLKHLQTSGEAAEVLKQRLFRLPNDSQQLLAVGAILGREFRMAMAAAVAQIPAERVLELLQEPRRNHLVWERGSEGVCVFMHDQIRDAILNTLTSVRRKEIHRHAAVYLSQHEPDRIFDIAFHHDASGRPDLARDAAIEAGERARYSHALETAEQQYRIALRSCFMLCEEPDFRVLYGLGDILMLSGRYTEAEPLFEKAIQCADSLVTRAEVTLKLGELAFKEDQKDRAIALWESALISLGGKIPGGAALLISTLREIGVQTLHSLLPRWFLSRFRGEPGEADRLIWRLHSRLAYAYWFVRSKLEVLHSHLRGMNLAERYRPGAELAQAYSEHAPAMSLIPLSRRGIAYGRRSLQIRREQNDLWGQGQSLHCLAIALYSASQFEECVDVGRRSVRILERAGDFWEKHIAQYQVAASLYRLGRFTEAVQLSRDAYDSGIAVGDFQVCGNIIEVWARASHGDIPPRILQAELDRPRADVQGQAHVLLAKGVCLMAEEHFEAAVEAFDQGIRVARGAGISNTYTSPLYAWKATALRSCLECSSPVTRHPRRKIIRQHSRAAIRAVLTALRFRNELPHALRELAWAQVFRNRNRIASRLLMISVRIAASQRAVYERIQSELILQRIRTERDLGGAKELLEQTERELTAFRNEQLPRRSLSSVSLADRFESLLESGRRIASATDPKTIEASIVDSARRLLRSLRCEVIPVDDRGQPERGAEQVRAALTAAIRDQDAVTVSGSAEFRSLLACPVVVRGRCVSGLVASSSDVRDLFGANEIRIARYLTAIAGAALENAEGFHNLQELNTNLEKIVEERTAVAESRSAELLETADNLRRTQSLLAAARDAAEQASRAKTDFLAHMSHEIRTPIGAVLGFTELLLNGEDPLRPNQRAHLQRVLSNGSHLHRLLNDLLDLSRIEAGALTIEMIECAPYPLIHDVMSSLQSRAVERNLRLSLRVADRIPVKIQTDPTRLRQILTNLIGNAIKFTSEGGVDLTVTADRAAQQLRILVSDTGPGIPLSAQRDVFEPFKQADASVVRKFGGTGLGLPISRRLARALGGDIELSSEPGLGTTMSVTVSTGPLDQVPMLDGAAAESLLTAPMPIRRLTADLSGIRILIADDVEANRELFAMVLTRAGAVCTLAVNGQEAVDAVRRTAFDLVLMDMQMPVMDGYRATENIRSLGVTIPVMAVTANGMREDRQRCEQAGCSAYLTKPISINSLLAGVAEQLGRTLQEQPASAPIPEPSAGNCDSVTEMSKVAANPQHQRRSVRLPDDPAFRDFSLRFLSKVEHSLPEMQQAVSTGNAPRLRELAHWIKGTGGTVGLMPFTEIGMELNAMAKSADFGQAGGLVDEISRLTRELLEESQASSTVAQQPL